MSIYINHDHQGIWKYDTWLPRVSPENRITMGEGNTPLIKSRTIAKQLGISSLYFKLESGNPTGSYKDRISALGVSWALEQNRRGCVGTSSGNAGASTAAYAARAGLPYDLLVLEHILEAKLMQAALHGARIRKVKGFGDSSTVGDQVFSYIEHQAKKKNWEVMITAFHYNSIAMQAVKTISFELFGDLNGHPPDAVIVPVGGGGLCTGILYGYKELKERKIINHAPSVVAVQSDGCANIVRAWEQGKPNPVPGDSTSSISGLQVPNPPDGWRILEAYKNGEGWGESVMDEKTWEWQEKLALEEGILCEPAAAITLSGLEQAVRKGRINKDASVVCILTGAGFKDSDRLRSVLREKPAIPLIEIEQLEVESGGTG